MGRPRKTDWKKVERQFRAGVLSISEIGRENAAPEATIRYRAKKNGWERDLTSEVRSKTRIKLVENLASARSPEGALEAFLGDEQIIEEASRTQVQVVREHQKTLGEGHKLTMRMLSELEAVTAHMGELQQLITSSVTPVRQEAARRAISLGSRATMLRDLATAARLWMTMERQAFNIVDDRDKNNDQAQQKLNEMTAEELRKEILSDAKKIGIELTSEELDKHVGVSNGKVH